MLDITTIKSALYDWVFGVSGITTIHAHPNAGRPKDVPYNLINIVTTTPKGESEYEVTQLPDYSIDVDYSTVEELFVSINSFRSGAFQMATKLKDSLSRVTVLDELFTAGLGYSKATTVQNIPNVIDKNWEERGQFDCFFFTRSLDSENIETIRKVEITNEIDDSTIIIEKPITP